MSVRLTDYELSLVEGIEDMINDNLSEEQIIEKINNEIALKACASVVIKLIKDNRL